MVLSSPADFKAPPKKKNRVPKSQLENSKKISPQTLNPQIATFAEGPQI